MMSWEYQKYVCTEESCGKRFNTKWTLKRHSVKHQKDSTALYNCAKCNKGFSRKDSLDRHNHVSHSDIILMYMCSEKGCGKLFSLKSTLYRHVNSHTQCFTCLECGNKFSRKDNLTKHKAIHTKNILTPQEKSIETDADVNLAIEKSPNLEKTMECKDVYSPG